MWYLLLPLCFFLIYSMFIYNTYNFWTINTITLKLKWILSCLKYSNLSNPKNEAYSTFLLNSLTILLSVLFTLFLMYLCSSKLTNLNEYLLITFLGIVIPYTIQYKLVYLYSIIKTYFSLWKLAVFIILSIICIYLRLYYINNNGYFLKIK